MSDQTFNGDVENVAGRDINYYSASTYADLSDDELAKSEQLNRALRRGYMARGFMFYAAAVALVASQLWFVPTIQHLIPIGYVIWFAVLIGAVLWSTRRAHVEFGMGDERSGRLRAIKSVKDARRMARKLGY